MNRCVVCNEEFEGRNGRPNLYCGPEHQLEATKTKIDLLCKQCGKPFNDYPIQQFCSQKCHHDSMRLPQRSCKGCDVMFAPERDKTQFHSKECEINSRRSSQEPMCILNAIWVPLTKGMWALVDEEDAEKVMQHSWSAIKGRS